MSNPITISADGAVKRIVIGRFRYLVLRRASNPVQISFDGSWFKPARQGMTFGPIDATSVTFKAENGLASDVEFDTDMQPLTYQEQAQSNASTYAFGNLGVAIGGAAAGGLPACDANGYLQITNGMALLLDSTKDGNRRVSVTLTVAANSPAPLNVLDENGKAMMTVIAGDQVEIVHDAKLKLSGAGGTAWATVGQFFLK